MNLNKETETKQNNNQNIKKTERSDDYWDNKELGDKLIKVDKKKLLAYKYPKFKGIDLNKSKYINNQSLMLSLVNTFSSSKIMSDKKAFDLISLLPEMKYAKLIYDSTEDGYSPADYHRCCDGVVETLMVIQSIRGRIGGLIVMQIVV